VQNRNLFRVTAIHDVNHSFGVAVAEVGVVRRSIMDHRLVDGIGRFVREDTSGEARHHLGHARLVTRVEDVVVDQHVLPEKLQVCSHVGE